MGGGGGGGGGGGAKMKIRVASPESVPIHLKKMKNKYQNVTLECLHISDLRCQK